MLGVEISEISRNSSVVVDSSNGISYFVSDAITRSRGNIVEPATIVAGARAFTRTSGASSTARPRLRWLAAALDGRRRANQIPFLKFKRKPNTLLSTSGREAGCGKLVREGRYADRDSHPDRPDRGVLRGVDGAMPVKDATIFKTPTADDPALAKAVRRLIAAYQPESIYLFGSVARGDADQDSDYDLAVVVPDDAPEERRRSRLAYEALRGTGTAADVLVCTRSYFEDRRTLKASLPGTVLRAGRLLHGS